MFATWCPGSATSPGVELAGDVHGDERDVRPLTGLHGGEPLAVQPALVGEHGGEGGVEHPVVEHVAQAGDAPAGLEALDRGDVLVGEVPGTDQLEDGRLDAGVGDDDAGAEGPGRGPDAHGPTVLHDDLLHPGGAYEGPAMGRHDVRTGLGHLAVASGVEPTGATHDDLAEDQDALRGGQPVDGHDEEHVHGGQDLALEPGGQPERSEERQHPDVVEGRDLVLVHRQDRQVEGAEPLHVGVARPEGALQGGQVLRVAGLAERAVLGPPGPVGRPVADGRGRPLGHQQPHAVLDPEHVDQFVDPGAHRRDPDRPEHLVPVPPAIECLGLSTSPRGLLDEGHPPARRGQQRGQRCPAVAGPHHGNVVVVLGLRHRHPRSTCTRPPGGAPAEPGSSPVSVAHRRSVPGWRGRPHWSGDRCPGPTRPRPPHVPTADACG